MDLLYPYLKDYIKAPREDFLKHMEISLDALIKMPGDYKKPLLISSFFGKEDHCMRVFHENNVPVYDSPEKAARAMAALYRHQHIRTRTLSEPEVSINSSPAAESIMHEAGSHSFDEYQAKLLLKEYGIPTTAEEVAASFEQAAVSAHALGYPVVLKACSADISHKTEQGLVYLNIEDEEALKRAYGQISKNGGKRKLKIIGIILNEQL